VTTNRGVYEAGALVFTSGAWNGSLLPQLERLAVPERQVLAWFQPLSPQLFAPETFPVFNMQVGDERYYGFPVFGVPGFKFGKYRHLYEQGVPESFEWEPNSADEAVLREFAAEMFPLGNGPVMSLKTCMFTNSPDDHFIIDLHPDYPQVSFAAGFSGHGYEFASVVGEIMADLALERHTRHDIDLFRLARFEEQIANQEHINR
jgi:sarcosine oxidase